MLKYQHMKKGGANILGILFLGAILILALNIKHIQINGKNIWKEYLEEPINYIQKNGKVFLSTFTSNMENIRNNKLIDFDNMAPTVNLK